MQSERDALTDALARRSKRYAHIVSRGVYLVASQKELAPISVLLCAQPRNGTEPPSTVYRYGDVLCIEHILPFDDFRNLCVSLGENEQVLPFREWSIRFPRGIFRSRDEHSHSNVSDLQMKLLGRSGPLLPEQIDLLREFRSYPGSLYRDWPTRSFLFQFNTAALGSLGRRMREPLPLDPESPMMPNLAAAQGWWFHGHRNYDDGFVRIHLPSYGARIAQVSRNRTAILVRVEIADVGPPTAKPHLRYFVGYPGGSAESSTVELGPDLTAVVSITDNMESLHLALAMGRSPESVDYREYDWGAWRQSDITYEVDSDDVELRAGQGEDEVTEFKLTLPKDEKDILETVVSFCNTSGGVIIIGIDNNGNVAGLAPEDSERFDRRIAGWIGDCVEPTPSYRSKTVAVRDKQVLVLTVAKGANPPYNIRGKGIYTRSGSTDRIISRADLDALRRIPR